MKLKRVEFGGEIPLSIIADPIQKSFRLTFACMICHSTIEHSESGGKAFPLRFVGYDFNCPGCNRVYQIYTSSYTTDGRLVVIAFEPSSEDEPATLPRVGTSEYYAFWEKLVPEAGAVARAKKSADAAIQAYSVGKAMKEQAQHVHDFAVLNGKTREPAKEEKAC